MCKSHIIKFKNEFASAEVYLMENGKARIRSVYSTKRKKGYASSILQEVVDYADEKELNLYLVVQRYGRPTNALSNDELEQFYAKFGFERLKHKGHFVMMCRTWSQKSQVL